jgi:hypothetical protein
MFGKSMPAMEFTVVNSAGRTVGSFNHDAVDAGGVVRFNGNVLASGTYTLVIRYGATVTTIPVNVVK